MKLLCCGINHQTASVAVRERFVLAEVTLLPALQSLQAFLGDKEAMIISTCNRFEVYTVLESTTLIEKWLADYFSVDVTEVSKLLYHYYNEQVVHHAIRVASGLDSMVLGEPQILGQMKCAYAQAGEVGCIGQHLGHLFPFVFSAAKKVRTETSIGHNPVSVASTAVSLAKQIFNELADAKVLLLGAGEIMELVAKHLTEQGVCEIIVANRTLARGELLAQRFNGKNIIIADIPHYIPQVDIIITSTASQLPLLGKGLVERAMRERPQRAMFIVDIAVPRDVEPEVAEVTNVHLYNIDDLKNIVAGNQQERQIAAHQAEAMVIDELASFKRWHDSLDSVPAICAYRQQVEEMRDAAVQKALTDLAVGKQADLVIEDLARSLTNKLMHSPSIEMRKASSEGRSDLLQWSKQLLGLQPNDLIH